MRVFREEDPMDNGYTVVNNDVMWADLSCRALGLLVRWLSKPPGVEVDTVPEIVTRAKRRGNKRMEGRDALYTASYELEEEGYLVRRQVPAEKGQYEWVAFVRGRPVPPEERSNPADRVRESTKAKKQAKAKATKVVQTTRKGQTPDREDQPSGPASSQVTPETGFPGTGHPVPGNPDSDSQAFSYKDSLNSSLSSAARPGGSGDEGEREEGQAPQTTTAAEAASVAAAWAEARRAAGAEGRLRGVEAQIAQEALELLVDGWSLDTLIAAAQHIAPRGWKKLSTHLERQPLKLPQQAGEAEVELPDWCEECDGPDLAERQISIDGKVQRCPECHPLELANR